MKLNLLQNLTIGSSAGFGIYKTNERMTLDFLLTCDVTKYTGSRAWSWYGWTEDNLHPYQASVGRSFLSSCVSEIAMLTKTKDELHVRF